MYKILTYIFKYISRFNLQKSDDLIDELESQFEKQSNEEIKKNCRDLYLGKAALQNEPENLSVKDYIVSLFGNFLSIFSLRTSLKLNNHIIEAIALGSEAFKRAPADLPLGSSLFPEQIKAAISLTQRCLVQMNTGEGKTYAILPAAFALACQYQKVYIVCANSYLAVRDYRNTSTFWDFVGLDVGLCTDQDIYNQDWGSPVIYTTIDALMFTHMRMELAEFAVRHPIKFSAVIIDEADAVLLDGAQKDKGIVIAIKSESYDWAFATSFINNLKKDVHVKENYDFLYATLTVEGEQLLKEALQNHSMGKSNYIVIRQAVEYAYAGMLLAKEGVHYIIKDNQVHPIDMITGRVHMHQDRDWIYPIEYSLNLPQRIEKVTEHVLSIDNFLKMFSHLSGTSGSIIDNITEYVFTYQLFTNIISPRRPRFKGDEQDLIYKTKGEAKKALINATIEAVKKGRPVLIGTQNINDAEELYNVLANRADDLEVRLITGKNEDAIAETFAEAGKEKVITIATQLAGRGVDIKLSSQSRENGGLCLLCLEHSLTKRHDKQFLGRAGRQGDPYTSVFFVSLEDELMLRFSANNIAKLMEFTGYKEGEVIKHSMVTKSIERAQNNIAKYNLLTNATSSLIKKAEKEVYDSFRIWLSYIKIFIENENGASEFLDWLVNKYLSEHIAIYVTPKSDFNFKESSSIIDRIKQDLDLDVNINMVEGKKDAIQRLKTYLTDIALEKMNTNKTKTEELYQRVTISEQDNTYLNQTLDKLYKHYEQLTKIISSFEQSYEEERESIYDDTNGDEEEMSDEAILSENTQQSLSEEDNLENVNLHPLQYLETINNNFGFNFRDLISEMKEKIALKIPFEKNDWKKINEMVAVFYDSISDYHTRFESNYRGLYSEYLIYKNRQPKKIIYWSFFFKNINYHKENDRDNLRLRLSLHNDFGNYNRIKCDEVIENWEKTELSLSAFSLNNLLKSDTPEQLESLFFYEDNATFDERVGKQDELEKEYRLLWQKNRNQTKEISHHEKSKENSAGIIKQFVTEFGHEPFLGGYSVQAMEKTLTLFLNLNPMIRLQTSNNIQKAMDSWRSDEVNSGTAEKRREINKKWILLLLSKLREQKLISHLPSVQTKINSRVQRLIKNLSDPSTLLVVIQPTLFLMLFIGFSLFGHWLPTKKLTGWQLFIDNLFFGGLLSVGAITASCFFVAMLNNLSKSKYSKILLSISVFGLTAIWQIEWASGNSVYHIGSNVILLIAMMFFVYRTVLVNTNTKIRTGISLHAIWLCFCISFVFFPRFFGVISKEFLLFSLVTIFYCYWRAKKNYIELTLLSYLSNSTATFSSEPVRSFVRVEGSVGYSPHLYASLVSFIAFLVLQISYFKNLFGEKYLLTQVIVIISIYFVFMVYSIWLVVKTRLSHTLWEQKLNNKYAVVIDGNVSETIVELDLQKTLYSQYKKLFYNELFLHLLVTACCFIIFKNSVQIIPFPAFIFIPSIIFIFAASLYEISTQFYKIFISRIPTTFEYVDFSTITYEETTKSFWGKIKNAKYFERIVKYGVAIFLVAKFVIEVINDWHSALGHIKNWFK